MNHTSLWIRTEFTVELDRIAFANSPDPGRQVDVVRDEKCPAAGEPQDESLVAAAVVVVGQDANDRARAFFLAAVDEGRGSPRAGGRRGGRRRRRLRGLRPVIRAVD